MRTDSIKYHVLLALAHGDTPLTCAEIWDAMNEEYRPKAHGDSREWANITSHTASLYAEHYVDRRKRDAKNKPFEYWLAARGREELRQNGHLPDQEDGDAPVPENTDPDPEPTEQDAPEPEADTVTCEACGKDLEVGPDQHASRVLGGHEATCVEAQTAGTDTDLADPDAIADDLGLEDPDVDSGRALAEALAGVVSTLRETERAVDNLREDAVSEMEMEDRLQNSVGEGLLQQVETLKAQVQALSEAQARDDGVDTPFRPYIRRLKQLDGQGYGLYEGEIATEYGGNVVEVRVKAKPRAKCDKKGPTEADGERVTVSKGDEEAQDDA